MGPGTPVTPEEDRPMTEPTPEPVEHPEAMLPHETETPNGFPEDVEDVPYGEEPER